MGYPEGSDNKMREEERGGEGRRGEGRRFFFELREAAQPCVIASCRRGGSNKEKMQGKASDCSGCVAHLHHVGEVITQGTPSIIHIDKNPFKIGRLGCDEYVHSLHLV